MERAIKRPHPLSLPIKMIWVAIAMMALFQWGVEAFSSRYRLVIDPQDNRCIPEYSVYLLKKQLNTVEKGKIYAFRAKGMGPFYPDGARIGKYALGREGDTVVQNEHGVFINGKQVAAGYAASDKLLVQPEHFYKTYTLKKGEIYFGGTDAHSFDSRYWGAANVNQIIGEAIPLW